MKYLIIAGMIAALSIVTPAARANSVTEFPAIIDGTSDFTAIHTDNDLLTGGTFTDHFTFNLSGDFKAAIFIRESDPIDQPGSTITFISADLNGVQLNFNPVTGFLRVLPFTLVTGPLVLTVTGFTDAGTLHFADGSTSNSSYFGRLAVPEPPSMMLLGAGLVMLLALARKQLSRSH